MPEDRVKEIAALLVETGRAHGKYEASALKGIYDQDWPRWYAGYAVEQGISALIGHAVTVDQLAKFFIASYAEFQQVKTSKSWPDYTARKIQAML